MTALVISLRASPLLLPYHVFGKDGVKEMESEGSYSYFALLVLDWVLLTLGNVVFVTVIGVLIDAIVRCILICRALR